MCSAYSARASLSSSDMQLPQVSAMLSVREQSKFTHAVRSLDFAGMRNIDPLYKLQMNIKIAMLYLEDDDPVNAETFIKKASSLIAHSKVGCYPSGRPP